MPADDEFTRNLNKLETLIADARTVTREGHEMIKDLRKLMKDIPDKMDERFDHWAQPLIQENLDSVSKYTHKCYDTINEQFKVLTDPMMSSFKAIEGVLAKQQKQVNKLESQVDRVNGKVAALPTLPGEET